jgi:integrase
LVLRSVRRANTRLSYEKALLPAREWFAHRKARDVTREDVELYRDHLRTAGRRVKATPARRGTWGGAEIRQFITAAAADRMFACWLLSLLGLRRAEVLGLMWDDIRDGTITIRRARVLVNGTELVKAPKSERSGRELPLFEPVAGALEALKVTQMGELDAAGTAYSNSGYVCCDELGEPFGIERYSDEFHRIAGDLPRIRLHDCRASVNSYLERLGVSDNIRSMWLGHTVQVNRGSYLRAQAGDLDVISDALGELLQTAV